MNSLTLRARSRASKLQSNGNSRTYSKLDTRLGSEPRDRGAVWIQANRSLERRASYVNTMPGREKTTMAGRTSARFCARTTCAGTRSVYELNVMGTI